MAFIFLVLIIVLVAAWIIPSYLKIHNMAQQKSTRGDLDNLRKGINLFFLQRGRYPYSLEDLEPNFVHPFPRVRLGLPGYPETRMVTRVMVDSGMWFYDENTGEVKIDCQSKDTDGEMIKDW